MTGDCSKTGAFSSLSVRGWLPAWVCALCHCALELKKLDWRHSGAGWRGTCAIRTLYGVTSRWAGAGLGRHCSQGLKLSSQCNDSCEGGGGKGLREEGWRKGSPGRSVWKGILILSNSNKFAILRWLRDATSKSKLSCCHPYLLQLETLSMCLLALFLLLCNIYALRYWYESESWSLSSGIWWPGWKNAISIYNKMKIKNIKMDVLKERQFLTPVWIFFIFIYFFLPPVSVFIRQKTQKKKKS